MRATAASRRPGKTPNAERIRDLWWIVLGITGVIFVIVEATLVMFVVEYRSRGAPAEEEGPQIRGHTRLELIWTVIPVLILVVIIGVVFYKLPGIKDVPGANAAGAKMTVRSRGASSTGIYTYPNGAISVNELRLPTGRSVDLEITAPVNDVIHSWWVPALAGKMDAIPGKVNHLKFETPATPGSTGGNAPSSAASSTRSCSRRSRIVSPADFVTWVAARLKAAHRPRPADLPGSVRAVSRAQR